MDETEIADSEDKGYDNASVGAYWKDQLERATRYFQKWHARCEKIENIYLDQQAETGSTMDNRRNFPMLWANISVLQPSVYARPPIPAVERRFKDSDPVARVGSEMIERALTFLTETAGIDPLMRQCRDDFLLFGRAVAWVRYEADIESTDMGVEPSDSIQAEAQELAQLSPIERITDERTPLDYVHWSDFLHSPARRWEDVTWVARRVPMNKDEIKARFGQEAVDQISGEVLATDRSKTEAERAQNDGKTGIWEIWCKSPEPQYPNGYTVWIADGSPVAIEVSEPPLKLENFWPCPRPAYGTTSTGSLIPVPDYTYYQGQCDEIDRLTLRITKLTDQLRLKGFYPAGDGEVGPAIEKAMQPNNDTIMVPIPGWAAFTDKGGSNALVWLPVDEIQKTIVACIEARKQLIDDVYQITGISDIVRGDTHASETATAQRIKTQWGSIRIRDRQGELARFARDIVAIAGEIICDQFQGETLMAMTGLQLPTMQQKQMVQMQAQQAMQQYQMVAQRAQMMGQQPPPPPEPPPGLQQMMEQPTIDEVMQLLRDDNMRGFRIDIETDSTIEPDEDAEKQRRMEFAQVMGQFIYQAGPVAQQQPLLVPVLGEVLLFVARGFRAGRQLESTLEQTVAQLTQQAMQPPPPPQPDPNEQIKLQTTQIKAQAEDKKAQLGVVAAQADARADMARAQMDIAADAQKHQHAQAAHENKMELMAEQHKQAMQKAKQPPQKARPQ